MVGGNPKHDAYGFRYWKNPGSFAEYVTTGSLGRFEGFLGAYFEASFTIVGPEYVSMVAGEAIFPRKTIKQAFKTMYWRFGIFFILGALCVGIILPSNDPTLLELLDAGNTGTAQASPYVIAMQNLGITVLPDIVNALMVTSIFSAGNSYVYCASRTLYGLAIDGHAPKFLRKTTKTGIPIYCFLVTMIFPFLSFLSVSSGASEGLKWLANLTQASQLLDYCFMCITYLFFYRGMKAQGFDRSSLPCKLEICHTLSMMLISHQMWAGANPTLRGLVFFACLSHLESMAILCSCLVAGGTSAHSSRTIPWCLYA